MQGASVRLTVQANGVFAATSDGCSFSGRLTPRLSGKNVFDMNLRFGPSPCALPGQTATGIAIDFPLGGGQRQLIVAGSTISRDYGTVMFGAR